MTAEGLCYERRMDAVHPQRDRAWHPVKRVSCKKMAERSARRGRRRRLRHRGSNFVADNHPVLGSSARPPGDNRCRQQDDAGAAPLDGQASTAQRRYSQHPASARRRSGRLRGVVRGGRAAALVRTAAGTAGLTRGRFRRAATLARMGVRAGRTQGGRPLRVFGRLDVVGFRPCPALRGRHAAATAPALLGVLAAAQVVHARERLAGILACGWPRQGKTQAEEQESAKGERGGRRDSKVRQDLCRRVAFMRGSGPKAVEHSQSVYKPAVRLSKTSGKKIWHGST